MIDTHVHIERGSYNLEWVNKFVSQAIKNNISTIYLLEHSFRFFEFRNIYDKINNYNKYQSDWLTSKMVLSIDDYIRFIKEMKKLSFPIEIKWGLEVCYIPGKEKEIEFLISKDCFDFMTGSVHWINNWGFDHKSEFWNTMNINETYKQYYQIMLSLVESKLFNHLAHPDSIKCFNHYPTIDLDYQYKTLSDSANSNNVKIEVSSGLFNNYGHNEIGINKKLLKILRENKNQLIPASDAHKPDDVGKNILKCYELICKTLNFI